MAYRVACTRLMAIGLVLLCRRAQVDPFSMISSTNINAIHDKLFNFEEYHHLQSGEFGMNLKNLSHTKTKDVWL